MNEQEQLTGDKMQSPSPSGSNMDRDSSSEAATKPLCLTVDCHKDALWKGLCRACYAQALQLIDKQETTWEELATLGMVELKEKPFIALFRKKKLQNANHSQS
jgi:hypothetical protein